MSRAVMEQARYALELCRLNGGQYLRGPERDVVFSALAALRAELRKQPQPAATADASLGAAIEAIDAALAEQAQPVACKFSRAQVRRLWDNSPERHGDATSFAAFERIVRLVEAAHRIGDKAPNPPAPQPLTGWELARVIADAGADELAAVSGTALLRLIRAVETETIRRMGVQR